MIQLMLGMGCDRHTSLATLEAAIKETLALTGLNAEAICGMATIDKKSDESSLLQLAEKNNWPLHFFNAQQLAQVDVPNPSDVVMKYMGTPAVAEAAAMLAAKTDMRDLIIEKHKHLGSDGKNATVSIVRIKNE